MTNKHPERFRTFPFILLLSEKIKVVDENSGVTRHMDFSLFYFASADGRRVCREISLTH